MSDTPIYDGLLEKTPAEEKHAAWAGQVYALLTGAEALLREASEG